MVGAIPKVVMRLAEPGLQTPQGERAKNDGQ